MKTFRIKVPGPRAGSSRRSSPERGVYLGDLNAVRALLTPKRLHLLHLIRRHAPSSINRLAALARRDFKNVHADVTRLKRAGLVGDAAGRGDGRTAPRTLTAPYQAIRIHAAV